MEGDQDEFKRVLTEGNPLLLGLTFVVSLLHSVFDMLAFKNDIGFWKNKKSMEGLSIKSIFINAFCQVLLSERLMPCCSAQPAMLGFKSRSQRQLMAAMSQIWPSLLLPGRLWRCWAVMPEAL